MRLISLLLICLMFSFNLNSQERDVIYFSSEKGTSGQDIFRLSPDGKLTNLTSEKLGRHQAHHINLKVSPDRTRIVYQSDVDAHDRYSIWVMDTDGGNKRKVSGGEGLYPNWSPDGEEVVFSGRRKGVWEIIIVSLASGEERIVTNNYSNGLRPGWGAAVTYHPNGKEIVYTYIRDKKLLSMNLESREVRRMHTDDGFIHPVFSPEGNRVAVHKRVDNAYSLVIYSVESGKVEVLMNRVVSYSPPSWSADGQRLLYVRQVNENFEVFSLDLREGKETRITKNGTYDLMPSW